VIAVKAEMEVWMDPTKVVAEAKIKTVKVVEGAEMEIV
jgi:hypothetical protein